MRLRASLFSYAASKGAGDADGGDPALSDATKEWA